ncbi:MAG: response regulator [Thermoanaerobaculia bacterium]
MKRPGQGPTATLEILLVEDDQAHAELIIRCLENHPLDSRIRHLSDGEAALDYLLSEAEGGPGRPHVILLDLRLPKIDGLEVLRQIRAAGSLDGIPVIVLSTTKDEADVKKAYSHHVNSYLVKPLDFATFTKLLDDVGYYWLQWNHFPGRILGGGH